MHGDILVIFAMAVELCSNPLKLTNQNREEKKYVHPPTSDVYT